MKFCPICDFEFQDQFESCPRHNVPLQEQEPDAFIGKVLRNRYRVVELIGRGSMGSVYKVEQDGDPSHIALKVLHPHLLSSRESLKRFHHEAKASMRLRHPHIVQVYDVGILEGGQPYITMEMLEGRTLSQYIRLVKHVDAISALPIIRQVTEALTEAHSKGVVHRDMKPANIMLLNRYGQENYVVVVDFSIAKVIQRVSDVESTTPGLVFGSPAYMSPERFMGKGGDFRSDIYSLGIVMFQMFAGRVPFKAGDIYSLMNEHIHTPPPPISSLLPETDIPNALQDCITKALAKRPEDRQANAREMLNEIHEAIQEFHERTISTSNAVRALAAGSSSSSSAVIDGDPFTTTAGIEAVPQALAQSQSKPALSRDSFTSEQRFGSGILLRSSLSGKERQSIDNMRSMVASATAQGQTPNNSERSPLLALSLALSAIVAIALIFLIPRSVPPIFVEVSSLMESGRYAEASRWLLMSRKTKTMNSQDSQNLDKLTLCLAKEQIKRKDLTSAGQLLDSIPSASPLYKEAQSLSRKYKKQLP